MMIIQKITKVLQHLLVYDYEERWGWLELFRDEYIQELLFKRMKRMLQESNPRRIISDTEVKAMLDKENENRTIEFANIYKIAYKK